MQTTLHREWYRQSAMGDVLGVDAGILPKNALYHCRVIAYPIPLRAAQRPRAGGDALEEAFRRLYASDPQSAEIRLYKAS